MIYAPRPYQKEAIDAGVGALTDGLHNSPGLIVEPTGSGKSIVAAGVAAELNERGIPTIVTQPTVEILEQNMEKLIGCGIDPTVWSASKGSRETGGGVTLVTIGSVVNHPEAFEHIRAIIVDECHLVNSVKPKEGEKPGMYRRFFGALPKARILGLTATPWRMASNSFGTEHRFLTRTRSRTFRRVVHVTQIGDLFDWRFAAGDASIEPGGTYLCPLKYRRIEVFKPEQLRLLELNSQASDYTDASVKRMLSGPHVDQRLVDGIKVLLDAGRRHVVVFTRLVDGPGGALVTADGLGDDAVTIHAKMPAKERREALWRWRSGEVKVAVNVGVLALGVDFPALEAAVIATPMASLGGWYQKVGRVVRRHPGKEFAEVVDLCGNLERFGRIEDLVLRPGRETRMGIEWDFWSGDRQMTNKITPAPEKAAKRGRFWASGAGQARRRASR